MEEERQIDEQLDEPVDEVAEGSTASDDGDQAYQRLLAERVRDFASVYAFYVKRLQSMVDVFAERSLSMGESYITGVPSDASPSAQQRPERANRTTDHPMSPGAVESEPVEAETGTGEGDDIDESMLVELPVDGSTSGEPPEEHLFGRDPTGRPSAEEKRIPQVATSTEPWSAPSEVGEVGVEDPDGDVSADDEILSLELEDEERLAEAEESEEERLAEEEERDEGELVATEYRDEEGLLDQSDADEEEPSEGSGSTPADDDATGGDTAAAPEPMEDGDDLSGPGQGDVSPIDLEDAEISEIDRKIRDLEHQIRELTEDLGIADD